MSLEPLLEPPTNYILTFLNMSRKAERCEKYTAITVRNFLIAFALIQFVFVCPALHKLHNQRLLATLTMRWERKAMRKRHCAYLKHIQVSAAPVTLR